MTAAARNPPTAAPAPPGCREPLAAPAPVTCGHCRGERFEPDEECDEILCLRCNGSGVEAILGWEMPRTRAYGLRRASYRPAAGASGHDCELLLEVAAKPTHRTAKARYVVHEIECDWPGRAFVLAKVGGRPEVWNVFVGAESVTCDCPGESYLTSAKANQRAHECGDETYPTFGCKHCDFCAAALRSGWFDL